MILIVACSPQTSGTMRGVVVEVGGELAAIEDFTVLVEGEPVKFLPTPDGDYAFPLSHLQEHLRTGEPVLVGWETVDGTRLATSIEDG
ncbi:MAG: hypothetical protein ACRDVD_07215 [Acidimicrobiia bacterium]